MNAPTISSLSSLPALIGNTPLIRLINTTAHVASVEVYAKAEWFNPSGSVKDRAAWNIVRTALDDGRLSPEKRLLDAYHASMVRVAMLYTGDRAQAEDVAQETWVAVIKGIGSFEGRSALKTWVYTILTNRAKTKSQRERRSVPFSDLQSPDEEAEEYEPAVAPSAFADDGWWRAETHPHAWGESPEAAFSSAEVGALLRQAIEALPPNQRQVITLRDVEGWDSDEVCNVLGVSESNQRVLLHRARAKVRLALDEYFNG